MGGLSTGKGVIEQTQKIQQMLNFKVYNNATTDRQHSKSDVMKKCLEWIIRIWVMIK